MPILVEQSQFPVEAGLRLQTSCTRDAGLKRRLVELVVPQDEEHALVAGCLLAQEGEVAAILRGGGLLILRERGVRGVLKVDVFFLSWSS